MALGIIPDYGSQAAPVYPLSPANRGGAGGVVGPNPLTGYPSFPTIGGVPVGGEVAATPHSILTGASGAVSVNPGGPMQPGTGFSVPGLPPAGPPAAGGGGGMGADPAVLAALGLEQQGLGSLDAQLRAQREQAIINFGDPALAAQAGFGLDPQAGAFAQQSYLSGNSTLARLDRAHHLASQAIINRLAGHGLLNSGDLGYLSGEENQNYGNSVYDARQAVLSQLANLFSGYLSSRNQIEQGPINAMQQSLQNYLANPDAYAALYGGGGPSRAQSAPQPVETTRRAPTRPRTAPARGVSSGGGRTRAAMA